MPTNDLEEKEVQRSFYFLLLLSQTTGLTTTLNIPNAAVRVGALGYMIVLLILYILMGIPLLYMELIIGQFTGLNCIKVWKVRPFLSQFGYLILFRQVIILIYYHLLFSFTFHYFLITFENPIPYYTCGKWATKDCGIVQTNYSINQDCVQTLYPEDYCDRLFTTFPEYQYWRNVTLKVDPARAVTVTWRVVLPSALGCIMLYLSCFKRENSLKWFLGTFTLCPILFLLILMMGSMLQKGIVLKFQDALDVGFQNFAKEFGLSGMVVQMVFCVNLGNGLAVNLGASSAFRTPSYANSVLVTAAGAAATVLAVCSTAMMGCPYAYRFNMNPGNTLNMPMTMGFERIPMMLQEYENSKFWNLIVYSCNSLLSLRTVMLVFYNMLQVLSAKFTIVAKYPGITTVFGVVVLFFISLPMIGPLMSNLLSRQYRNCVKLISLFVVAVECIVFVLWYGLDRFCEDVHFMQGIKPKAYMKLAWVVSTALLIYSLNKELYTILIATSARFLHNWGFWFCVLSISSTVLFVGIRLSWKACKGLFWAEVRLSRAWKPRSEVLQRSRAMFSAQAMTKEYLYRQFHLQAGVLARQARADTSRRLPTA